VVIKEEPVTQQVVMDSPTQVIPEEEEPANMAVPTQLEAPSPRRMTNFSTIWNKME
jgi:hypothetical protein